MGSLSRSFPWGLNSLSFPDPCFALLLQTLAIGNFFQILKCHIMIDFMPIFFFKTVECSHYVKFLLLLLFLDCQYYLKVICYYLSLVRDWVAENIHECMLM